MDHLLLESLLGGVGGGGACSGAMKASGSADAVVRGRQFLGGRLEPGS